MLYIEKGSTPPDTVRRIDEIENGTTADSVKWRSLPAESDTLPEKERSAYTDFLRAMFENLPRKEIRSALFREQHGICAYCMRRIKDDESTHIEHWYPLSNRKSTAIDYRNFLASCNGEDYRNGKKLLCCDNNKHNKEIGLTPLNMEMMEQIAYESNGKIYFQKSPRFTQTQADAYQNDIDVVLNLNDPGGYLKLNREAACSACTKELKRLQQKHRLTYANVEKIVSTLLQKEQYEEYTGIMVFYYKRWLQHHR